MLLEPTLPTRTETASAPADVVRVFDHEPDLLADVDEATARVLRDRAVAPLMRLEPGPWEPPVSDARLRGWLGLLVLDGVVTRSVMVGGRDFPELVGGGDLLRPWDDIAGDAMADEPARWRVLEPTSVALLDRRFAALACRCPGLVVGLLSRTLQRSRHLAFHLAIAHVRHADQRLRMLFWHLADRWGRVTPNGVLVPVPLTHELLAHLTGMRRPTASTALRELADAGEVVRQPHGWLLTGERPA